MNFGFTKQFKKYGDTFDLVENSDIFAIYERTAPGVDTSWETVIFYINGKGVWYYPGSSSWGMRGWTFDTPEKALAKYKEIISTKQELVSAKR